ncbi:MAG: T9SS type A sorting domain-containing protein [Ignavibacteriae bacterium]|nr:T9SS type A sorting domain-containing protein [Ignavibacteriota bacterium]
MHVRFSPVLRVLTVLLSAGTTYLLQDTDVDRQEAPCIVSVSAHVYSTMDRTPALFCNEGRKAAAVRYYTEADGAATFFLDGSIVFTARDGAAATPRNRTPVRTVSTFPTRERFTASHTVARMFFAGTAGGSPTAGGLRSTNVSFIDAGGARTATAVDTVSYRGLYPGVDLHYYLKDGRLKYDILARTPAHCAALAFSYPDADSIRTSADGRRVFIHYPRHTFTEEGPTGFQLVNGIPQPCATRYYRRSDTSFGLEVQGRAGVPVYIDPVYSTLLGGNNDDLIRDMDVFNDTLAYCLMETQSSDIDVDTNGYATTYKGGFDMLVFTMNLNTKQITNKTYLGRSNADMATGLRIVDSTVVILGATESADFPVTPDAFSKKLKGIRDQFIAVFDLDCRKLLYSTYFGGNDIESTWSLSADKTTGRVAFGGSTFSSSGFPITPGNVQSRYGGGEVDAYIGVFNVRSRTFEWSTYLGGNHIDEVMSVELYGDTILFGGNTGSYNFPVTQDAVMRTAPSAAAVMFGKLNWKSSKILYSTYFGGSYGEDLDCVTQTSDGGILVTGTTYSDDYPTTPDVIKRNLPRDGWNTYIAKFDTSKWLSWSTRFGGDYAIEYVYGIAEKRGLIWLYGGTGSIDYPKTDSIGPRGGERDATLSIISRDGRKILYSLIYSGSGEETFYTIGFSPEYIIAVGLTSSPDFPCTPDAAQKRLASGADAHLTIFRIDDVVTALEAASIPVSPRQMYALFPNPARGSTTVTALDGRARSGRIVVWNSAGRCVARSTHSDATSWPVDLSACPPGVYFLECDLGNDREVRKIVVE